MQIYQSTLHFIFTAYDKERIILSYTTNIIHFMSGVVMKISSVFDRIHGLNILNDNVASIKGLRKSSVPYVFVWIVYYAWVIGFTTWWTGTSGVGSAFGSNLRIAMHISNLISSATCMFIFKKDWFEHTAKIGATSIIIALGLYLIAPSSTLKIFAAILLGASLGCMNISILIPFTFVLNNTEKLFAVAASHMLSSTISLSSGALSSIINSDAYLAWFILLLSLSAVPFFKRKHLPDVREGQTVIGKNVRPAMAWTVIVGTIGAIFFLGVGKAILNAYAGPENSSVLSWYHFGGIAGGIVTVLIFAIFSQSVYAALSIPFGALAIGLSFNAFGSQTPGMETLFGILLGAGTTIGMSITYYIIGVVGKKYNSMFFLRMAILIIGICGGIPGILIGNGIDSANASEVTIIVSAALSIATILVLIVSPTIARILFNENWAKDVTKVEIQAAARAVEATNILSGLNLTPREKEICTFLLTGEPAKNISSALKISQSTVAFHCQNLYRKLNIQSRAELFNLFTPSLPDISFEE